MAKRDEKKITCTVEYTEGCENRLTEALVEIYYARKKYGMDSKMNSVDKTA